MSRVSVGLLLCGALLVAGAATAQDVNNPASKSRASIARTEPGAGGPRANTTSANARVMVPDGTSYTEDFGAGPVKWFTAALEAGKTYTLEVIDPFGDLGNNFVGGLTVYDADGTTTPPTNMFIDCSFQATQIAPSFEVSTDGARCGLRPFIGISFGPQKIITFAISEGANSCCVKVRLKESGISTRWTTNGYHMFIAVQNTGAYPADIQVAWYPSDGTSGFDGIVTNNTFTLPAYGAVQVVRTSGSTNPNTGTARIISNDGVLETGQINVQAYAFNPAVGNYLFFVPTGVNQGGPSTW